MGAKNSNVYFKDAGHLLRSYREMAALFPAIKPTGYARKANTGPEGDRILTAMWSDQHYGTDLTAADHLVAYSGREECRATAKVLQNILEYKRDKRAGTTLHLDFLGDDFAGMLGHDDNFSAELQVQMARTAHIEAQIIRHCAAEYPAVVINRQWGNHGRDTLRHKGRADNFKWVNWEWVMWLTVRALCRDLQNVRWNTARQPISFVRMFGHTKALTHGDTVLGGKPGSVTFAKQLAQIASNPFYKVSRIDIAELGHWHSGQQFTEGHTEAFVNPALIPPDGFSQTHGFLTANGQFLYETTPTHAVGDVRKVRVDVADYSNSKLDGLIEPWSESLVFEEFEVEA